MLSYSQVPMANDMAPYAPWYMDVTRRLINSHNGDQVVIVEAGSRYGCSARIFRDALQSRENWKMYLLDMDKQKELMELVDEDPRVSFTQGPADRLASKFEDGSVSLLHVDVDEGGRHTYETAFKILLAFWNKLRPDGEVIFHDCSAHFPGILKLVNELKISGWTVDQAAPASECPIASPAHAKRQIPGKREKISVVIPVIKTEFLPVLLDKIKDNTVRPDEILVVANDNQKEIKAICNKFRAMRVRCLMQDKNIGVNASWNLGLDTARNDIVCFLNDDVAINNYFFDLLTETFRQSSQIGYVVPSTVLTTEAQIVEGADKPIFSHLQHREGWAFAIRKNDIKPIPGELMTFFGDDWFYNQTVEMGLWPIKILNNRIYHNPGISQNRAERDKLGLISFEEETKIWATLHK